MKPILNKIIKYSITFFVFTLIFYANVHQAYATITFKSEGSIDTSGAAQHLSTPVYTPGVTEGDLLVLIMGMKPSTANNGSVTTPEGWTLLSSYSAGGYGTTLGADTGNTNIYAFYRIADGTGRDERLEITLSTDNITWATIENLGGTLGGWDLSATTGAQNSTPTSPLDITFSSDPGVAANDFIIAAFSIPTDVGAGAQFSAESFTQTGVTFGTKTEIGEIATSTGNDTGGVLVRAPVSSGTSSAVPHLTSTLAGTLTNVRGPALFIHIREVAAPGIPTFYEEDGGSNQIAFKGIKENDETPIVRLSAVSSGAFDRFQVEFNTQSNFKGTAYTETFSGSYSSATAYNLQTTGALGLPTTNGVTYFVRARASADSGSHYGPWSTKNIRSFTYTNAGNPKWFQTTDEQFNEWTTATDLRRTGSGSIQIADTPYIRGWTSGARENPSTTIVLDKPANTRPGDLLLIFVGNDDSTATAQWNDTTFKPTGFTMINEAGNATPDTHTAAFYRIADGSETDTITVTAQSSDDYWGYYIRVVGADGTTPIDVIGADACTGTAAATSCAITAVTTTVANTLAFYLHGYDGGDGNPFGLSGTGWVKGDGINATGGSATDANAAGGSWGTKEQVSAGSTGNATVSSAVSDGFAGFQFAVAPSNATSGTIMSPEVDYDWVIGASSWGDASFSTTETNGDVKLQVYYTVSTACDTIVSDGVLPGNSSGFDVSASPINISGLTPVATTYNHICLKATLTNSGGTPTLDDWTISWGLPPTACTANTTGSWNTGSNWVGCTGVGGIPGTGDDVVINSGITMTMDVDSPVLGSITVNGTLDTSDGTSRNLSGTNINVSATGTLTANASTITLSDNTGTIFTKHSDGTFNAGTSTVVFSGNGDATLDSIALDFYSLTSSGTGTKTLSNVTTVAGDLTVSAGILTSTENITVNGDVKCGGTCGVINHTAGIFEQRVAVNQNFGTSASADNTAWTFTNLKFSNSTGTSKTITVPSLATGDITVTGGVVVGDAGDTAGTVLDAGNRLWILSGLGAISGTTFPTVEGRTNSTTTSNSTSHTVNFDNVPADGDLLIVAVSFDGSPTVTWPTAGGGWTELSSITSLGTVRQEIRYRVASGDSSSISLTTSNSERMAARAWRIAQGQYTGVPEAATAVTDIGSANPDSPSITASWGSYDNLFISLFSSDTSESASAYPTNYTLAQGSHNSTSTAGTTLGYAGRKLSSDTDDPSAFTKSGTQEWIAQTIVVQGYQTLADVMTFSTGSSLTGATSTFRYTGNGATIACDGANYNNLELFPSGSTRQTLCLGAGKTLTVGGNLTIGNGTNAGATGATNDPTINVTGNVTIAANATFIATGGTMTIGGTAFTKNGTFTHNDGTVIFNNTGTVTLGGATTQTTFYNFTATTASTALKFKQDNTYVFNGLLNLGSVSLDTDTGTGNWIINHQGTESINGATITRSSCHASSTDIDVTSGTNGGSNGVCWLFPGTAITISGTSSSEGSIVYLAVGSIFRSGKQATVSGGTWTLTSVLQPSVDGIVTVWLNAEDDTGESTAITKWSAGDITGMVLEANVLTIGSNQDTSVSATDLGLYDADDNEDIMHTSNSGTLLVQGSPNTYTDETLSVLASNTLNILSSSSESLTTKKINNAGTINASGTPAITISGASGTLFTNSGTFNPDNSTVNFSGDAATVTSGAITFYNLTLSGTGAKTFTGTPTVNGIYTLAGDGTVAPSVVPTYGASATLKYDKAVSVTAGSEWLATFTATGGIVIANTGAITLDGAKVLSTGVPLTINSGATLNTSGSNYSVTFGGDFVNNGGTFTANASPLVINGTATQSIAGFTTAGLTSMTKTGGTATFTSNVSGAGLTINGVGGTLNLGTSLTHTFTGDVSLTAGTLNGGSSTTLNINNTSTTAWSGNGSNFITGTGTVSFGGGDQTLSASTTIFNNLDFSGTGTKTLTSQLNVNGNLTNGSGVTIATGNNALNLNSNFTNSGVALNAGSSPITITGTATQSIAGFTTTGLTSVTKTGGTATFITAVNGGALTIDGVGGTLNLGSALGHNFSGTITLTNGTLNGGSSNITAPNFSSSNSNIRSLNLGSGTWTLTSTGTVWNASTSTNLTVTPGTSTIKIIDSSASSKTFAGGSKTYGNLWFAPGAGTGSFTISGSNTFKDLKDDGSVAHSVLFTTGTSTSVSTWNISGSPGNLITINSTTTGTHTLIRNAGIPVDADYLNIQHSITGSYGFWFAGQNSINNQSVASPGSGWIFQSREIYKGVGGTSGGEASNGVSGSGATAEAVLTGDVVTSVNMISGGSNYVLTDMSFCDGGGSGATGTSIISSGVITGVNITNGGSGYTSPPTVLFRGDCGGDVDGGDNITTYASGTVVVSGGAVTGVDLTDGGNNYSSAPIVSFCGGGGSGASGTAILTGKSVTSVNIDSGGSGYNDSVTVLFGSSCPVGGGGGGGGGDTE